MNAPQFENLKVGSHGNPQKQPPWLRRSNTCFAVKLLASAVCATKKAWTMLVAFCSRSKPNAELNQPIDYEKPPTKRGKKVSEGMANHFRYDWEKFDE